MDFLNDLLTLLMLLMLQAVLGFDNLLYISLESKRAPADKQAQVRKIGIAVAVIARIVLLILLTRVISMFTKPFLTIAWGGWVEGSFNFESVIVLLGGVFILYTAVKEIFHMIGEDHLAEAIEKRAPKSAGMVIFTIVLMNLVFSFDSILSAMALAQEPVLNDAGEQTGTRYVMWVMATAIIISGLLMIWLADKVSSFLEKNRLYEVLGLFILLIVGVMLVSEGAHKAHLTLFGNAVMPMTKTTFYFVIAILVAIDIVQSRYQKKLMAKRAAAAKAQVAAA